MNKLYRTMILHVVSCGYEVWIFTLRGQFIEGVSEQNTEEDIRAEEGGKNWRLGKTA
jgi:hypothetical protein